jgi:hypothetical protein
VAPRADGAEIARQLVSEILGVAVAQDLGPKDIMPETTRREADRGIAPEHAEGALIELETPSSAGNGGEVRPISEALGVSSSLSSRLRRAGGNPVHLPHSV